VSKFVPGKIIDRKLNGDNFLSENGLLRFILVGESRITTWLTIPDPKTQTWRQDDALLLGQNLNSMKPRVKDLILHYIIVKELWTYLDMLYSGYDVI